MGVKICFTISHIVWTIFSPSRAIILEFDGSSVLKWWMFWQPFFFQNSPFQGYNVDAKLVRLVIFSRKKICSDFMKVIPELYLALGGLLSETGGAEHPEHVHLLCIGIFIGIIIEWCRLRLRWENRPHVFAEPQRKRTRCLTAGPFSSATKKRFGGVWNSTMSWKNSPRVA